MFRSGASDSFRIGHGGQSFAMPRRSGPDHILDQMRRRRAFYETDLLETLGREVGARGGVALDVGANVGNHTLYLAGVLGLRVLSFEPVPSNRDLLLRMVDLNDLGGRITVLPYACGDAPGEVFLETDVAGNPGTYHISEGGRGEKAELVVLDEVFGTIAPEAEDVAVLKIDVEGAEPAVLRGARRTIDRFGPVISVEASTVEAFDACSAILSELGYVARHICCATPTVIFLRDGGSDRTSEFRDEITEYERLGRRP